MVIRIIQTALVTLLFSLPHFGEASLQRFCDQQMSARYLMSKVDSFQNQKRVQLQQHQVDALIAKGELSSHLTEVVKKNLQEYHDWDSALIPTELTRLSLLEFIPRIDPMIEGSSYTRNNLNKSIERLNTLTCSEKVYDGRPRTQDGNLYLDSKNPILTEENVKNKDLAAAFACSEFLGVWSAKSCDPSFAVVERIAKSGTHNITAKETILSLLKDSRYDNGLKAMANLIEQRVNGDLTKDHSLYEDLLASFNQSGQNSVNAEEMTWNVLAVLSTGGPISERRLRWNMTTFEQSSKFLSMNIIIKALPILDHRSSRLGHVYSFPKNMSVTCNTSKSYHFWFAAFLARRAALETGAIQPSAVAAYQAAKAYHVVGRNTTIGRKIKFVLDAPSKSPVSQVIRMDLVYAAAGAVYGANKAGDAGVSIDIDTLLQKLMDQADQGEVGFLGSIAGFTSDTAATYGLWLKKFNANFAFQEASKVGFVANVNSSYLGVAEEAIPYNQCVKK